MARYKPNHKSIRAFLLSDQLGKPVHEVSALIAQAAKINSPRGKGKGPHMADQFEVERNVSTAIKRNPRVGYLVVNKDRAAAPNEFGTKNNARHRMLGRAGARFGDFKGVPE